MRRNGDFVALVLVVDRCGGFDLRLIEQVSLLSRELLAPRTEPLRVDQPLPLAVERDQLRLLVDRRLLLFEQ